VVRAPRIEEPNIKPVKERVLTLDYGISKSSINNKPWTSGKQELKATDQVKMTILDSQNQ
tara:strand:- start:316 stop:495 length:180 start_codon:yes stop_codon:yes gene_type:complete